jgi:hypothetical protein
MSDSVEPERTLRRARREPTEEELKKRKEKKNLRNRSYYERHKDEIRAKKIETYDSERRKAYYYERHDDILQSQRKHYKTKINFEKEGRLNALLPICEKDEGLTKLIQTHLENLDDIRLSEISALEKSVILAVNK